MRYYIAEKVKNCLILVYADYTKTAGAALRLRSVTAAGGLADCWQNVAACRSRPLWGSLCVPVRCLCRCCPGSSGARAAAVVLDPVPISGAAPRRFQREASAGSAHRVRLRSAGRAVQDPRRPAISGAFRRGGPFSGKSIVCVKVGPHRSRLNIKHTRIRGGIAAPAGSDRRSGAAPGSVQRSARGLHRFQRAG